MAWPFVCSLVNEKLGCECANVGCGWKTVSVRALWKTYLILDFLVCAHAQHSPSHPACLKKSEQKTRTEHWEKKKEVPRCSRPLFSLCINVNAYHNIAMEHIKKLCIKRPKPKRIHTRTWTEWEREAERESRLLQISSPPNEPCSWFLLFNKWAGTQFWT